MNCLAWDKNRGKCFLIGKEFIQKSNFSPIFDQGDHNLALIVLTGKGCKEKMRNEKILRIIRCKYFSYRGDGYVEQQRK
ncbi:MAG TPA: hypothetical protein DEF48_05505 [Nostoc sp. UBA8866]|nr:hypothetical protein [Nostoc sp. UBA8866]